MLDRLKNKMISDFRQWHKMWSSWLAVLWGIIVTAVWNDPATLQALVASLPEETRALLSPLVLAVVGGLPIIVRLVKQGGISKDDANG